MKIHTPVLLIVALFFSASQASAQISILSENFDSVVPPELPAGWVAAPSWKTSSSSASTGSGGNNLSHTGSSADQLLLPAISLAIAASGTVSYLARRTSSYDKESLSLSASIDGGATFPFVIIESGAALPQSTSTYEMISSNLPAGITGNSSVLFRFEATGGSSSGSNIRIDDLQISITPSDTTQSEPPVPSDSLSSAGFRDSTSVVLEQTPDFVIPIQFSSAENIRGFQFDLLIPDESFSLDSLSLGQAVPDIGAWTLDWHMGLDALTIIAVNQGQEPLLAGIYPELLNMHFSVPALSGLTDKSVSIQMLEFIISVAENDSVAIQVQLNPAFHETTIIARQASIQILTDSLNFGTVSVDSVAVRYLPIANPDGSSPLILSNFSTSDESFVIKIETLVVPPGEQDSLAVEFRPSSKHFGAVTSDFSFTDNTGAAEINLIEVTAHGTGGRGDSNRDGEVNVGDVLDGIDFALKSRVPSIGSLVSLDQFPSYIGDSKVDVRDLGMLIEAILDRTWSDGVALPARIDAVSKSVALPALAELAPGQRAVVEQAAVQVELVQTSPTESQVILHVGVPIRGLELSLLTETNSIITFDDAHGLNASEPWQTSHSIPGRYIFSTMGETRSTDGVSPAPISIDLYWRNSQERDTIELLLTTKPDFDVPQGVYNIGNIRNTNSQIAVRLGRGIAFDTALRPVQVSFAAGIALASQAEELPSSRLFLYSPYPNPWSYRESQEIRIPYRIGQGFQEPTFTLFDMLGRIVPTPDATTSGGEWRWRIHGAPLTPGLYFIRMRGNSESQSRPFIVVR